MTFDELVELRESDLRLDEMKAWDALDAMTDAEVTAALVEQTEELISDMDHRELAEALTKAWVEGCEGVRQYSAESARQELKDLVKEAAE